MCLLSASIVCSLLYVLGCIKALCTFYGILSGQLDMRDSLRKKTQQLKQTLAFVFRFYISLIWKLIKGYIYFLIQNELHKLNGKVLIKIILLSETVFTGTRTISIWNQDSKCLRNWVMQRGREKNIYIYFDSSPLKMPLSVHILNFEYRTRIGFSVFCFMPLFYIVWHNQLATDVTKYTYKLKV